MPTGQVGQYHTFHDELMSPCDERQAVVVVESLRNVLAECVASATGRYSPPTAVVRIRPEEIAHGSFMRNLLHPVDRPDMVESVN